MNVLVTGATGFVGRALLPRLGQAGHSVTALVRSKERAGDLGVALAQGQAELREAMGRADGVVNLAGESVLPRRWTPDRKRALVESRVETTRALVEAIRQSEQRPRVMLSASAVGYYGDRGEELQSEDQPSGDDFLARLCVQWEAAAREAETLGVRVVRLRIGIVLGRGGGALASMIVPFRFGLGGRMGSGRQAVSWIHLDDLVGIVLAALGDERCRGAINAVAPEAVSQAQLAEAIGRALSRPAWLPVPALALRLGLGEAAQALLTGQRVVPARLRELEYRYRFPELELALADALG